MKNNTIDNYRKTVQELLPEINANIKKYRKGNFKIKVLRKDGSPVAATVRAEQKKHAFDFGTNVLMLGHMGEKEQEYRDAITNLFNLITTTFCWKDMEPQPGKFRFEENSEEIYRRPPGDRVLKFAKENGMKAKGQPLFSGCWCPEWAPKDFEEFKRLWLNYVKAVAKRYDGEYSVFDVVNESYQVEGSWRHVKWFPVSFYDFVKWTLNSASELFSDQCIMERNELTPVNYGAGAEKYYEDNKKLLEEGVRLDAIGFQFHFIEGEACINNHLTGEVNLENIYRTYNKMSTLGVPMYITEITIPSVYEGMTAEEGESLQAEILENLYRMWFSIPNMHGIIYWNLKDGDTWVNESDCRGCLIDEYMRKKKSYYTLEHLIKHEWNTCVTAQSDDSGYLEFSGFYGDYDIAVEVDGQTLYKGKTVFDKTTENLNIVI